MPFLYLHKQGWFLIFVNKKIKENLGMTQRPNFMLENLSWNVLTNTIFSLPFFISGLQDDIDLKEDAKLLWVQQPL